MRPPRPVVLAILALGACSHVPPAAPAFRWTADVRPAAYFPLAAGTAWSYEALDPASGRKVLVVNRVQARDGNRAILSVEPDPLAYEDRGDAIVSAPSGKAVLRSPIARGASWLSGAGRATIRAVDATVDTPAGRFASCVSVEEVAADRRIVTSYAPGVGPVALEIYARDGAYEILVSQARLRSYHDAAAESP